MRNVAIPIQLWRGADDRHQPNPCCEEPVRLALPHPPDYHVVDGAGHYDFLPPCGPILKAKAPEICGSATGFDRAAFHQSFNAEVTRFFEQNLRASTH